MSEELDRWKQAVIWLDECEMRLRTILEEETDADLYTDTDNLEVLAGYLREKFALRIKSRELNKSMFEAAAKAEGIIE